MSMEVADVEKRLENAGSTKSIGLMGAFSIVAGCIVGSGIFMTVGDTMHATPPSVGLLIIYWIIGGVISLVGGLSYAELGGLIPKSGGERTYLAESFGYRFGVTFTYSYVFVVKSITFAALGITTGKYFVEMFLPNCRNTETPTMLVAYAVLFIVFMINIISVQLANKTQIIFTITKMLALLIIIITGFVYMGMGHVEPFKQPFKITEFNPIMIGTVFINVLWSYEGWNSPGAIVGEMINPARDLPLAIGGGVIVVILLYVSTIIAYISVLGYDMTSSSDTVAILFAAKMYGKANFIIPIFICCSAFGACNGGMLSVARVALVSGYEGDIAKMFSLVHRTQRTPVVSLFCILLTSCMFVPTEFKVLLDYAAFVTWMFYFMVMTALIYFKYKRKDLTAKFRVPVVFPLFIQLVSIYMVIMAFYKNAVGCSIFLILIVGIFAVHWLPARFLRPKPLVRLHDRFCAKLMLWFNLTFADENDIS